MWLHFLVKVRWRVICAHRNYHVTCMLVWMWGLFLDLVGEGEGIGGDG